MTGVCRLMPGPQWLVFPAGPLCGLTIGPRALAQAPDSPVPTPSLLSLAGPPEAPAQQPPVSVSLQAVSCELSCCQRCGDETARFSELTEEVFADMVFGRRCVGRGCVLVKFFRTQR